MDISPPLIHKQMCKKMLYFSECFSNSPTSTVLTTNKARMNNHRKVLSNQMMMESPKVQKIKSKMMKIVRTTLVKKIISWKKN